MQPTPWLLRPPAGNAHQLQLWCFPYAGGAASTYLPWQAGLSHGIEVCAVQLPGRGPRLHEPPLYSLDALVEALAQVLRRHARPPFAFFGHSLGGLVAFELARHCRRLGLPLPRQLFVSASSAPPSRTSSRRLHELDDDALIAALRDYNGTPPAALENRELMDLLLPAIRADFAMLAGYQYRSEPALDLPITVLAGTQDRHVEPQGVSRWQECSTQPCRQHWFEGDHFFIHAQSKAVVALLNAQLGPAAW